MFRFGCYANLSKLGYKMVFLATKLWWRKIKSDKKKWQMETQTFE